MFARSASIALLALPLFASAATLGLRGGVPSTSGTTVTNACNTGPAQCCDSTQNATSTTPDVTKKLGDLGLLDVLLGPVDALVGITCSPIVGVVTSTSCSQQPVCCTNNSFKGVVALGCTPINIGA